MSHPLKYILSIAYYLLIGYFSYLMTLITLQYIPVDYTVAFLNVKVEAIQLTHYKVAFFSHVYTSIFVLILGSLQFSTWIRSRFAQLHRMLGSLYIALVLLVSSPSGLIMAIYANGGKSAQLSFSLQAILWFLVTALAFYYAKEKKWTRHSNFMLRSYALTLSAITLRLLKWVIANFLEWPPMDTYRLVSWLGWLVNLAVIEVCILYFLDNEK